MIQLAPARAARLLVLATKMAKPRVETLGAKEGPLHKLADSHSPKLSVAIRYAFASARSAMRPALQSREDIKKATALGIVTLRQELREVLPKALRKIYVAGGELAASALLKTLGGPGSGNFGHSGRPGEVGGSGGEGWTPEEPPIGDPGSPERYKHIAWEHGKTWREKAAKLEVIKSKPKSEINWSRDWEADTRVSSIAAAEDEIELFQEREHKALNYLKNLGEFRAAKRDPSTKIDFSFDDTDENAVSWADKHAAELIDGISETSREDINNAVAEFLETGDFAELRDEILAAVGDVERADRIARNEPMVAVHEGQRAAWDQAVEAGLLPETAVREWIIVGDDKVCPVCEGLEGKTAALGEEYEDGIEGPPAHVMCRCSEGLSSSFKSLGGQGSGNFGHAGRPGEVGGSSSEGGEEANSPEEAQKIIEAEQRKYLTPEEYDRLPPGIRAWKTRTRKEKEAGKVEEKPKVKKEEPKVEDKPKSPAGVIATKDREEAISKRIIEIHEDGKLWKQANEQARKEDEEKNGPLPANSLLSRSEAINQRFDELVREAHSKNKERVTNGQSAISVNTGEIYRQAKEEDAQKWGPYAHPEEVEAIRQKDAKWSPAEGVAERDAKLVEPVGKIEREVVAPEHQSHKQAEVRGVADQIAREMNFDPALIAVRDRGNSPITFELNGKTLTQGGHYNPQTGRIEVNASYGVDRGLIAHEIQHAQWDYVNSQAKIEQDAMQTRWSREQAVDFAGTKYFLKNGKIQAKYRDEFEAQVPHTSLLARAGLGSKELGIKMDVEGMIRDDGASEYSKEYWVKAKNEQGFGKEQANYIGELAVNETLSEISRRVHQPRDARLGDNNYPMAPRFVKLNKDLEALYSKDLDRVQRHFGRKKKS